MLTKSERECLTPLGRRMAQLIEEQERSGLSVGEFARGHGIEPGRFSWWRWEIRRRIAGCSAAPTMEPRFAEAVVVDRGRRPNDSATRLVVELGRGQRIEVPANFDD